MVRIAVIEADTPLPAVVKKHGSYGSIFTKLLTTGGIDVSNDGQQNSIETFHVVNAPQNLPKLNDGPASSLPDVVLISGSRHDSYSTSDEWIVKLVEFVQKCLGVYEKVPSENLAQPIKVVGICFGHQIIARALGARVGPNPKGWEISSTPVSVTEDGEKFQVFGPELEGSFNIMQMHRDIVFDLPPKLPGIVVTASNEVCEIQGLYKRGSIWSVQGHPEFTDDIEEVIINTRHQGGLFSDELTKSGLSRLKDKNDGPALARSIVKFILQ